MTLLRSSSSYGEISYGDYTFEALRHARIDSECVYDNTGRTITHVRNTLHIVGKISNTTKAASNAYMQSLRDDLSTPGQALVIDDIGIGGSFNSSTNGVLYGAQPQTLSISPIAGERAFTVEWTCDFDTAPCSAPGGIWSFDYEVSYSVDEEGLVERTITGAVRVRPRATTSGSRVIVSPGTLAAFDLIAWNVPRYMKLTSSNRTISAAKDEIRFTVVHTEIHTPYPDGMIKAEIDYGFSNVPPGFNNWEATISGSLTPAPGVPESMAAVKFFHIMGALSARLRQAANASDGLVLPTNVSIRRNMFGTGSQFAARLNLFGSCLNEIIQSTGLYTPVPGTSWQSWSTSLNNAGAYKVKGRSETEPVSLTEVVISPCSESTQAMSKVGQDRGSPPRRGKGGTEVLACEGLTEANSWLEWKNELSIDTSSSYTMHRLAKATPAMQEASRASANAVVNTMTSSILGLIYQYRGDPEQFIVMSGYARRIHFPPEVPVLRTVDGKKVTPFNQRIVPRVISEFFGCPVHQTRWIMIYRMTDELVEKLKPAKNRKTMCYGQSGTETG